MCPQLGTGFNRPTPKQWWTLKRLIGFDDRYDTVMTAQHPIPHAERGETVAVKANHHPTVKPLALMTWLVKLATPPGGTVLDCFWVVGDDIDRRRPPRLPPGIGIDADPESIAIAKARVTGDAPLFAQVAD